MIVQFNTDRTISGEERKEEFFTAQIKKELERFQSHISRIEVHLSDENGVKEGKKDIKCSLEARIEGRQPIGVTDQADNIAMAISGALDKLKASLKTIIGRTRNH